MASNFQIFHFQGRDSLHLQMRGDFDGTSAYELINTLKKQNGYYFEVFIDTSDLHEINAFGIEVFENNWKLLFKNNKKPKFIGKHKHRFFL